VFPGLAPGVSEPVRNLLTAGMRSRWCWYWRAMYSSTRARSRRCSEAMKKPRAHRTAPGIR